MQTGAVIIAAGHKSASPFRPLMQIGDTTVIRRLIIVLKQAGVDPVVVVTGQQGEELEKHVARLSVICLRNEEYEHTQMFDSIRMGLGYVQGLCDQVLVMPAKFPLLLPETVRNLLQSGAQAACPTYLGRRGHPVLLHTRLIPELMHFCGEGGLRAGLHLPRIERVMQEIAVEDEGILWPAEGDSRLEPPPKEREIIPVHPRVEFSLAREDGFFDADLARFLLVADHTGSMQTACRQMHISYTKGWKMLKEAQRQLGFDLLISQSGGADGGSSRLSDRARRYLERYLMMERELNDLATQLFAKYFEEERDDETTL